MPNPVQGETYTLRLVYDQTNHRWNPPEVFIEAEDRWEQWRPVTHRVYASRFIFDPTIDQMDTYFIVRNASKDIYRAKSQDQPRYDEVDVLVPVGVAERPEPDVLVVKGRFVCRLRREALRRYWGR